MKILVTGATGYVGKLVADKLSRQHAVIGISRSGSSVQPYPVIAMDIRSKELAGLIQRESITHVVHLAAVLEDDGNRELAYDIDVNGTANVVQSCIAAEVKHLTVSSSGAAYGYHADNPDWLTEEHPLRGNREFPYSDHKRLVEEMLADYRHKHPELQQLVLRVCTVLGANTQNLITNLFQKKRTLHIQGSTAGFVVIWDQDLVRIIEQGVNNQLTGIYNVAGNGALSMADIAETTNKPLLTIPAPLLKTALGIAKPLGLSRYGPEQLKFLQYRPVLHNRKLREEFAYTPEKSSREAFEYWWQSIN